MAQVPQDSGSVRPAPRKLADEKRPPRTLGRRLLECLRSGLSAGLKTALWLLAIMVPVSLAVTLLNYSGLLGQLGKGLDPVFRLLGLPGETAVAFVTCVFLSIYSGIAALGSLELTDRQVTILAMIMLISHNFPVEGPVQHKLGTPMWRTVLLRLAASLVGALALNLVLPAGDGVAVARVEASQTAAGIGPLFAGWALGIAKLAGMVAGIVVGLMVLQRMLREFGLIERLSRLLAPVLWLLGLPRRTAFLWIVANTLGLAYGSAVILEESRSGALTKADAQLLNRSIAICHSLLEDTILFAAIGAWALWITFPRLVLAAGAVWGYRLLARLLSAPRPPRP